MSKTSGTPITKFYFAYTSGTELMCLPFNIRSYVDSNGKVDLTFTVSAKNPDVIRIVIED